jgi:hypothetical protein
LRHARRDAVEPLGELPAKLAAPRLIPQSHGGALWSGGVPGHDGRGGRPPSLLRARLRGSLDERVAVVEEIADDPEASAADRIRAVDLLARYGLGADATVSTEDVRERLKASVELITAMLPAGLSRDVVLRLREVWTR